MSEAPRAPARGILKWMAELSVAFSPPSRKLRRALLAIHPRPSGRGILAKKSNIPTTSYPRAHSLECISQVARRTIRKT